MHKSDLAVDVGKVESLWGNIQRLRQRGGKLRFGLAGAGFVLCQAYIGASFGEADQRTEIFLCHALYNMKNGLFRQLPLCFKKAMVRLCAKIKAETGRFETDKEVQNNLYEKQNDLRGKKQKLGKSLER